MQRDPQELKWQYKTAKRKRAGRGKAPASGGAPTSAARAKKPSKTAPVIVALLLALACAFLAWFVWREYQKQAPAAPAGQAEALLGQTGASVEASGLPQLPTVTPVIHDPEAVAPAPVPDTPVEEATRPRGGWPELSFTEEETAALDEMLLTWAESTPPTPPASLPEGEEEAPAQGHRVALYFKDIHSGAEYLYSAGEKFDVASLSKAPYAMWIYTLVEAETASLEETFHITQESIADSLENTGVIKKDPDLPRDYTLDELLYNLLRHSDTVAQRVLLTRYPAADYAAWAAELGLHNPGDVRGVTSGLITAPDAGVYLAALHDYMEEGEYGEALREHLLNTSYPMIRSQYAVARKYGWDEKAYHDMAVVYAPHPYLLAILTDKSDGAAEDLAMFSTLTQHLEQLMLEKWEDVPLNDSGTRTWK